MPNHFLNRLLFWSAAILTVAAECFPASASDRYVTLTALGKTNALEISEGEVAELVSFPWVFTPNSFFQKLVAKRGSRVLKEYVPGDHGRTLFDDPLVIVGPGRFEVQSVGLASQSFPTFCTVRVSNQPYPPTGTVVIPPGQGGGNVGLECSTDLTSWAVTTNGIYTDPATAKFFRLTLERFFPGQTPASNSAHLAPIIVPPKSAASIAQRLERFVTLMPDAGEGEKKLDIPANQVARLVSVLQRSGGYSFEKDGLVFATTSYTPDAKTDPVIVAGPAKWIATYPQAVTLEFLPNAADPQSTVILPPGSGGGNIQLQLTTNLVDWKIAAPGSYTNLSAATFFRISLERLPK